MAVEGSELPIDGAESNEFRVTFSVISGPHQGKVFRFSGHDTFIVGRSRRAHFRLPSDDRYFSRFHFMVEVNPPRCILMDMGSRNGTWVNDERVKTAELKDGDLIRGGHTTLRVSVKLASSSALLLTPPPGTEAPRPDEESIDSAPSIPLPPQLLANPRFPSLSGYEILRELGRGGVGVVYLARRNADRTTVALKTIRPVAEVESTEVERFLREAEILKQLRHPYIVRFEEMYESAGLLCFSMEYVEGPDAAQVLRVDGAFAIGRAVSITCQILEALQHAHERGFVHRDIKPANILLTQIKGREEVRLVDFGLARVYQASALSGLTLLGETGGTLPFMAPEQINQFRESPPSVDQYAAAATLYNLLTDRFVYDLPATYHAALLMILSDETVPIRSRRPEVPDELARIIHRSLTRDPAKRFANAEELRRALLPYARTIQ
jgi:eukaryotic-like serine/threonine-protein kinase